MGEWMLKTHHDIGVFFVNSDRLSTHYLVCGNRQGLLQFQIPCCENSSAECANKRIRAKLILSETSLQ